MDSKILRKLFIHRSDVYGVQKANGNYNTIKSPITDVVLESHLNGKQTIGTYHLDINDTVKTSCIDIDVDKAEWSKPDFDYSNNWESIVDAQVREVKKRLSKYGIVGYEEFSGFKGSHVWYFFENPVPASTAKDINDVMFGDMVPLHDNTHFELFPKQNSTNGGLGNLIKLPAGLHKKSKKFSFFKDPIYGDIEYVTQEIIEKIISPIDAIFINCHVMNDLRSQAIAGHLTNNGRLALAYVLLNLGKSGEEALIKILENTTDYDEKITNYNQVKWIICALAPVQTLKVESLR